jgi:DNA-binding MarR family transcriptional regulator
MNGAFALSAETCDRWISMSSPAPRRRIKQLKAAAHIASIGTADPPLDYRAADSIGFLMRVTLRSVRRMLRSCLHAEGLTMAVWFYLRVLWEEDGLTQKELTERVGFMQPTSVNALKALQRDGFVTLTRDKQDRRKMRVFLTAKGRGLKRRLLPRVAYINDQIALKGFAPSEIDHLREYLIRIRANVDAHLNPENGRNRAMDDADDALRGEDDDRL